MGAGPVKRKPEEEKVAPVERAAPPIDLARIRPVVRERVTGQQRQMEQMFGIAYEQFDKALGSQPRWKDSRLKSMLG